MQKKELILRNFSEVRRRSIMLWEALPGKYYDWKPDATAMTALQMIRHVLQADYGWNIIINQGDMTNYQTPWADKPYLNVQDELAFAEPYRQAFLKSVDNFSETELAEIEIVHPGNDSKKILGDYLLRIGSCRAILIVLKRDEYRSPIYLGLKKHYYKYPLGNHFPDYVLQC